MYVCRNPKDTVVSFYKFVQLLYPDMTATFEDFLGMFQDGVMLYGSYWYHLKVSTENAFWAL